MASRQIGNLNCINLWQLYDSGYHVTSIKFCQVSSFRRFILFLIALVAVPWLCYVIGAGLDDIEMSGKKNIGKFFLVIIILLLYLILLIPSLPWRIIGKGHEEDALYYLVTCTILWIMVEGIAFLREAVQKIRQEEKRRSQEAAEAKRRRRETEAAERRRREEEDKRRKKEAEERQRLEKERVEHERRQREKEEVDRLAVEVLRNIEDARKDAGETILTTLILLSAEVNAVVYDYYNGALSYTDTKSKLLQYQDEVTTLCSHSTHEIDSNKNGESFYSIIGVPKDASEKTIKDAIDKLYNQYHPDKVYPLWSAKGKDVPSRIKEIIEDFSKKLGEIKSTLTDPSEREKYDKKIGVR